MKPTEPDDKSKALRHSSEKDSVLRLSNKEKMISVSSSLKGLNRDSKDGQPPKTYLIRVYSLKNIKKDPEEKHSKKDKVEPLYLDMKIGKKIHSKQLDHGAPSGLNKWTESVLSVKSSSSDEPSTLIRLRRGEKRILGSITVPMDYFQRDLLRWFQFSEDDDTVPLKDRVHRTADLSDTPALLMNLTIEGIRPLYDREADWTARREAVLKKPWRNIRRTAVKDQYVGDWNTRFQSILESIRSSQQAKYETSGVNFAVYSSLLHLTQDFIHCATSYGKIIMEEAHLPKEMKTITPQQLGGIAGGEKYIVRGILFKFAIDEKGLFDDPAAAAKVAGHDLKGLNCYVKSNIDGLCYPLMALLDYRGQRLIAISLIPIDPTTLVYGTADASRMDRVIHDDDEKLNEMMRLSARILNLKEHGVVSTRGNKHLASAIDLEGHRGKDGRYYLLDFSRTMPPVEPVPGVKNGYLYHLLRPEFVKAYPEALSPDAFAKYFREDAQDDEEVRRATKYLFTVSITNATKLLYDRVKGQRVTSLADVRITETIHQQGVNCRYLGMVAQRMLELFPAQAYESRFARSLVLLEMAARVIKDQMNTEFRAVTEALKADYTLSLEEPYRARAVSLLNMIFGTSAESERYWNETLKTLMLRKFAGQYLPGNYGAFFKNFIVTIPSPPDGSSMQAAVDGRVLLFERVSRMMGISLLHAEEFQKWQTFEDKLPIDEFYLDNIEVKVKQMVWSQVSQGFCFLYKAIRSTHIPAAAKRSFLLARRTFENALNSETNNKVLLMGYAKTLIRLHRLLAKDEVVNADDLNELAAKTREYLERALQLDPNDTLLLYEMAQYWQDFPGQRAQVQEYYLRALEQDPSSIQCLIEYGQFLQQEASERRNYRTDQDAERFLQRAKDCSNNKILDAPPSTTQGSDGLAVAELLFQVKPLEKVLRVQSLLATESLVWSGCENGAVYIWDKDGKSVQTFQAHQKTVYALELVGNHVWSASSDGCVRVWPILPSSGAPQPVRELKILPNLKTCLLHYRTYVLSFDTSGAILVWNTSTYKCEKAVQVTYSNVGICCMAKVEENTAWLGLSTGDLQEFKLDTLELGPTWHAHKRRIAAMTALHDNVWTSAGETIVWSRATRQPMVTLTPRYQSLFADGAFVWGALFQTNLSMTALTGQSPAVQHLNDQLQPLHVCEPQTGDVLQVLAYHRDLISAMCLFKESVWTGSADGTICVWKGASPAVLLMRSNRGNRVSTFVSSSPLTASALATLSSSASSSPVPRRMLGNSRPTASSSTPPLSSGLAASTSPPPAATAASSAPEVPGAYRAPPSPRASPAWGALPSGADARASPQPPTAADWPVAYRATPASPATLPNDYKADSGDDSPTGITRSRARSYTVSSDSPVRARELPPAYAVADSTSSSVSGASAAAALPVTSRMPPPRADLPLAYTVAEPPLPLSGSRQQVRSITMGDSTQSFSPSSVASMSPLAAARSNIDNGTMYQVNKALSGSRERLAEDSYNMASTPSTADANARDLPSTFGRGSAEDNVRSREPSLSFALLRDMGRSTSAQTIAIPDAADIDTRDALGQSPGTAARLSQSSGTVQAVSRVLADERRARRHSLNTSMREADKTYDM